MARDQVFVGKAIGGAVARAAHSQEREKTLHFCRNDR